MATIRKCPRSLVSGDVWEAVELINFAEKGAWPLGHGTLNETQSFTDAYRFYLNVRNQLLSKR